MTNALQMELNWISFHAGAWIETLIKDHEIILPLLHTK